MSKHAELISWANDLADPDFCLSVSGPVKKVLQDLADALDAAEPRTVTTVEELIMLPEESIIRGPDWHGEVYQKSGDVEYYGIASETPWLASNLEPRGPFVVLFTPVASA